jgi:hypothetical protein
LKLASGTITLTLKNKAMVSQTLITSIEKWTPPMEARPINWNLKNQKLESLKNL